MSQMTPSHAVRSTNQPESGVAATIHRAGSQAAAPSSLLRSHTLPQQIRLDTEGGIRVAGRANLEDAGQTRQEISSPFYADYYWGFGMAVEEGDDKWEDKIYQLWPFKGFMLFSLLLMMMYWTFVAVGGILYDKDEE
jgi:hypothetical protein